MTRKEFWEWVALCPAKEGKEEAGWFVAEDNGTEIRLFFWFDTEENEDELNDYEKLDWISFAIQEAMNGNPNELDKALELVEELREENKDE